MGKAKDLMVNWGQREGDVVELLIPVKEWREFVDSVDKMEARAAELEKLIYECSLCSKCGKGTRRETANLFGECECDEGIEPPAPQPLSDGEVNAMHARIHVGKPAPNAPHPLGSNLGERHLHLEGDGKAGDICECGHVRMGHVPGCNAPTCFCKAYKKRGSG